MSKADKDTRISFEVRDLGFAAYLLMQKDDVTLVGVTSSSYGFKSKVSLHDLHLQYSGSESLQHDREVCQLRRMRQDVTANR